MIRLPILFAVLCGTGLCTAAAAPHGAVSPAAPPARPFHSVAIVNDSLSHGTVGDALLSLDEAIRLHNGTLSVSLLSAAEQAQVSFIPGSAPTPDVTWIDIDAEWAGWITVQQDLTSIINTTYGLLIRGSGGDVTIDFTGPGVTRGFDAPTNSISLQNLVLHGGANGLDAVQTDVAGNVGCSLRNVRFDGQTNFGVRVVSGTANGTGRLVMEDCEFVGVPFPVQQLEPASGRTTIFELHRCTMTGATTGFRALRGGGGLARFTFDRLVCEASDTGIDLTQNGTQGRNTYCEGQLVRLRAATCLRIDAAANASSWLVCGGWQLLASAGGTAVAIGDPGDDVWGTLRDFVADGAVAVQTGGGSQPLELDNWRCRGGAAAFADSANQALTLHHAGFDGCVVGNTGTAAIAAADCCFVGGSVDGAATPGFVLSGCYAQNVGVGVVQNQPLLQAQLGGFTVAPDDVQLGAGITIAADLPAGLIAALLLGVPMVPPPPLPPPFAIYFDPAQFVAMPGAYLGQQGYTWNVPSNPQFLGLDFVAQALVLPLPGVTAPALQFPPPWRFSLTN